MNAIELIKHWMSDIELDAQAFNQASGVCAFRIADKHDCHLEVVQGSDDLFFFMDLLASEGGELGRKRIDQAMRLNAYGIETSGGVLGWDEARDMIHLSYRLNPESLSSVAFSNIIFNLVDAGQRCTAALRFEKDVLLTQQSHRHASSWFQPIKV